MQDRRQRLTGGVVDSPMKAKNLEKMFDEGKDITPHLALSKARRPGHEQKRVNVDFPSWIIESLDAQASRLGGTGVRNQKTDRNCG